MLRADHMVFPVWDAAASLAFYRDILELPLVGAFDGDDWGGRPWLMMIFALGDGRELVLVSLRGAKAPPTDGLPADVRHYAFSVDGPQEQAAVRDRLKAAGADYWEEDHGAQHSLYFPDPNGVILEITTPASRPAAVADPNALAFARGWIAQQAALTV